MKWWWKMRLTTVFPYYLWGYKKMRMENIFLFYFFFVSSIYFSPFHSFETPFQTHSIPFSSSYFPFIAFTHSFISFIHLKSHSKFIHSPSYPPFPPLPSYSVKNKINKKLLFNFFFKNRHKRSKFSYLLTKIEIFIFEKKVA